MAVRAPRPRLSVIIPALNEATHLRDTVTQLQATLPEGSDLVVVDDGSSDGCADFLEAARAEVTLLRTTRLGAARARNWGAQHARGDVLVFADAHIHTPAGWWAPLLAALDDPQVGAVAPVISAMGKRQQKGFGLRWSGPNLDVEWLGPQGETPYPVPLLPGACLAMRAETWQATGGFDEGIRRWGAEDAELSLRLWLLGYELRLVPAVEVAHLFRPCHPYAITWDDVVHNLLRLALTHFQPLRWRGVVAALKGYTADADALALSVESDVWSRRLALMARRVRDDEWFMRRFGMTF